MGSHFQVPKHSSCSSSQQIQKIVLIHGINIHAYSRTVVFGQRVGAKILHGKGPARKTMTMSSPKSPYIASLDQEDELFVVLRGAVMTKCL
jgi:hypothetical protein